jgi:hypothetical protein
VIFPSDGEVVKLAPRDPRTCARLCHASGGECFARNSLPFPQITDSRCAATRIAKDKTPAECTQPGDGDSGYNELMNCQVKDELVSQLTALNNKLNLLSPDLVHGDKERAEVQERRESLYAEIKHHRAKGHEGKPCPAARQV